MLPLMMLLLLPFEVALMRLPTFAWVRRRRPGGLPACLHRRDATASPSCSGRSPGCDTSASQVFVAADLPVCRGDSGLRRGASAALDFFLVASRGREPPE